MADDDKFPAFIEETLKQKAVPDDPADRLREKLAREQEQRMADSKLRGDELVKKNEEYIGQHRERKYQKQKAESERKLKEALEPHAHQPLDESSGKVTHGGSLVDPTHDKITKPLPFQEGNDGWPFFGMQDPFEPQPRLRRQIKSRGMHIINHCVVT